jgi:hypothetical protein
MVDSLHCGKLRIKRSNLVILVLSRCFENGLSLCFYGVHRQSCTRVIPLLDGTDQHSGTDKVGHMKKSMKKTSPQGKLALRREAIALLKLPQLDHIAGGAPLASAFGTSCAVDTDPTLSL